MITDEVAKLGQEMVKTTNTAIIEASNCASFIATLFEGSVVSNSFGLLADRLKFYRWERAELLFQKTVYNLQKSGVKKLRTVPPKILLPLIENASLEEDDDLHTMWANLLASGLDEDAGKIQRRYVSILSEITSSSAQILSEVYTTYNACAGSFFDVYKYECEYKHAYESVDILKSLGLLQDIYEEAEMKIGTVEYDEGSSFFHECEYILSTTSERKKELYPVFPSGNVELTELGINFCRATIDLNKND